MPIRVLTKTQELAGRAKRYKKLKRGCLFNLGGKRFFIAVTKLPNGDWDCIEFTEKNIDKIINCHKLPCKRTVLNFRQMNCLNLDLFHNEEELWEK